MNDNESELECATVLQKVTVQWTPTAELCFSCNKPIFSHQGAYLMITYGVGSTGIRHGELYCEQCGKLRADL